ncbi:MAG: bifunctional riboflavin kinase/FAD synthetase [Gammaproteobacteria bacterium]|nr:bifunctional riboflavin kinase/FAD synthetase [Gammaproteobacteria bacterium]
MEFIHSKASLRAQHRDCVLTIGNYDGVHLGHQAVLRDLQQQADRLGCPTTVMVFEPTPKEFFAGVGAPARLTNLREKLQQLEAIGVDRVLCVNFNRKVAAMSPDSFVDELIIDGLAARHVIVGDDFRYGRDRAGDFETLKKSGERGGFAVTATESFLLRGQRVSSSLIRECLARDDLQSAARFLGRNYSMAGRVRRGQQLGRQLGYPTANIAPGRRVLALQGIFAVEVAGAGPAVLPGIASLGTRPMVDGRQPLLEVHLFDFDSELYGRHLEVRFVARLRGEQVFADLPAMVEQMHRDAAAARQILAKRGSS